MLTELKLSNFRIFDDEVTVRFRPITILIGRNSSGKSSIVKFLLMLQQSIQYGQSQFLTPEGSRVSLGAFRALRNSLSTKRNLEFGLKARDDSEAVYRRLVGLWEETEGLDPSDMVCDARANVAYGRKNVTGRATYSFANEASGADYIKIEDRVLADSTFLGAFVEHIVPRTSDSRRPATISGRLDLQGSSPGATLRRAVAASVLQDELRYQINSIRHLSPVRAEAQRVIIASPPPIDDVGQGGEFALPHLQRMIGEENERYEFILPYLESVAGIAGVNFRTSSGYVSQAFARNKATGADALIADYGFGVSQCVPILVQGAIMAPQTTLMIEQPEAQLHPTAQLELGSFFAKLWKQRGVGSIIETHSDNILLRLRRLIARGDLSHEDVSVAFFTFDEDNGNMPVIKNLDINEDGSMEAGLPMEFFGADIFEGLQLGARA